jgi:membrane fusion protein, multidrug efflux system
MRTVPIVTAILVGLALYLFIMQRDAVLALAGAEPALPATTAEPAVAQDDAISVVALRSRARSVDAGIVLRGRTEVTRRVDVQAETSGLVISQPVPKGTEVRTGDVLCRLDPGSRPALLAEAEARLLEAEANDRASSALAERGFAAETTAIARKAALQTAQALVEQATLEISRLEIRAPFDGVLETDTAEIGSLLQPGTSCATLIAIDPIRLVGFVAERNVEQVRLGAAVVGNLVTGQVVRGHVSYVAQSADPATRTFRIEAEAPNPGREIRDGISTTIVIALEGNEAHLLPLSSLTLDDQGRLGIRAAVDGIAKFFPVTIIRDDPRGVWVSGLPDEVDVIVVGQDFVTEGQALALTYREPQQP